MVWKAIAIIATAGVVGLSADLVAAQQQKPSGQSREALAAKCRAQIGKVMPPGQFGSQSQREALFRSCMNNKGKI